jgi:hypothetical protein
MTTKEILIAARKRIEDPKNWVKGQLRDGDAVCALGALYEVAPDRSSLQSPVYLAYEALTNLIPGAAPQLGNFNDQHTHAEVLALFDRAIEAQG